MPNRNMRFTRVGGLVVVVIVVLDHAILQVTYITY